MTKSLPSKINQCASAPFSRLGKVAILAVAIAAVSVPTVHAVVVVTDDLNVNPAGQLNLGNGAIASTTLNGIIERASSQAGHDANIADVRSLLDSGNNGGLWDGLGIMSGTAADDAQINGVLGVMMYDNQQLGYPNFQGVTGLDSDPEFKQTLLRVTYIGDYDASGTLDSLDYGLLDFYLSSALIAQGDITADGIINGLDYGLMDFVLSSQVYGPLGNSVAPSPAAAAVPEPTTGALLLFGALGAFGIRRRSASN